MTTPSSQSAYQVLEYTGERMVPEKADVATFWEHIYRYRFAASFVRNQRVLDIACGEGYGVAALLKAGAMSAIGMDLSEEACYHARVKYGVDIAVAGAEHIPLPPRSIDIIVSFETIEHLPSPEDFVRECARVLTPGGTLVMSTPNRDLYKEMGGISHFHTSELSYQEFRSLLTRHFSVCEFYAQRWRSSIWWRVHSFVSAKFPWFRLRGFGRVRWLFQRTFCPAVLTSSTETHRRSPVELISAKERLLSALANPYTVRKWSGLSPEQAMYIVAVCHSVKA